MINENNLIKDLELWKEDVVESKEDKAWNHAIDKCIREVRKQEKENVWISLKERLPDKDGEYLVYYSCENDGSVGEDKECGYSVEYFDKEMESFGYWQNIFDSGTLGFVDSEFIEMDTAVAWMPLPKPYKEELKND